MSIALPFVLSRVSSGILACFDVADEDLGGELVLFLGGVLEVVVAAVAGG